jgi:hypothetical protein
MVKVDPLPSSDFKLIPPPMYSHIRLQIVKPSPTPYGLTFFDYLSFPNALKSLY